jgi:hypothetical protein
MRALVSVHIPESPPPNTPNGYHKIAVSTFSLLVGELEFFRNMVDCLVVGGVESWTKVSSSVTSQHRQMSFLYRRILQEPETGAILEALFSVTA